MSGDPDIPADVRIRAGDGTTVSSLTEMVFDALLHAPPDPAFPLILINRGAHDYIRARLLPDGVYELEHRAEPADELFQIYTPDAVLVRDVLWGWLDRTSWWCDAVAWYPVDPAIAELEATRDELGDLLDGFSALDGIESAMDDAMARADELLAMEVPDLDPQ